MNKQDQDFEKLNHKIDQLHSDKFFTNKSHGIIYLFLASKFFVDLRDVGELITDGANDCGVDAVFIDRKRDQPLIHIIQSKFHTSLRKSNNHHKASNLEKIQKFFEVLRNRDLDLSKLLNPLLEQKVLEIRQLQDEDFPEFKIWLISNSKPCVPHEVKPLKDYFEKLSIAVEEFHLSEFIEFCIRQHSARSEHVFRARDIGVLEFGNSELSSVVGYISARELYSVLKDLKDERKIDYSLFNMNVRGFLGLDSTINQEIFHSASSSQNLHFASFNNGITIVGSKFKVMTTSDMPKIGVKNMSIVNGAQTCSAIFDAMKDHGPNFENFDKLSVLFRLFQTDDLELIDKIAISTNSQNRINSRDLRANDECQLRLKNDLEKYGISYNRKRGKTLDEEHTLPELDALRAGQLLLSYVHHDPARAKSQSDNIFTTFYYKIFGNVDVEKLIEAMKLYSKIEYRQQYIADEIRIRGISRTENTFVTYGGLHILMLCALLREKDQNIDDEALIDGAISIIAEVLKEAGEPAFYVFFRRPEISNMMIDKATQPRLL